MEPPQLTRSQRIWGTLGFIAGSILLVFNAFILLGIFGLVATVEGCQDNSGIEHLFLIWTTICAAFALTPPFLFVRGSPWKKALAVWFVSLLLPFLGFAVAYVLISGMCA